MTTSDIERRLAYHEAGHAAVCLHYGIRFQDAWIDGDLGGAVNLYAGAYVRSHLAAVSWAGFFAEKMFVGPVDTDSMSDVDLLGIVSAATSEADIFDHRVNAENVAALCRGCIEAIANALIVKKRLTYHEVLTLVTSGPVTLIA
jgi:Zn-dependent protease